MAATAGASSASPRAPARPRTWSSELVGFFRARGVEDISEVDAVREDVRFMLPKQVREAVAAARGVLSIWWLGRRSRPKLDKSRVRPVSR